MVIEESFIRTGTFGTTEDGVEVRRFALQGVGGLAVEVIEYGAVIRSLLAPDRHGRMADVVLGYDTLRNYERDPFYLGAVIGRSANRIRNGSFAIDGVPHQLTVNNPPHHLHGGTRGFGKAVWAGRPFQEDDVVGVTLDHVSPDGDEGYPGRLRARVTYTVQPDNVLMVQFEAETDRPTPVNLAQHSYFNLGGEGRGGALDHELIVHADAFTPLDASMIPDGTIRTVEGTPLDFRTRRVIGDRIAEPDEQLRIAGGYDHNFVLRQEPARSNPAARLMHAGSGRVLHVATTEPGMQLYTGNFLDGSLPGKHGHRYGRHAGVCLETQHFPDSPNQPAFPSTILRPGEAYRSRTEFRFSVD